MDQLVRLDMQTSLTDQMFQAEQPKSLTDQMFAQPSVSLTDQMFAEPKPGQVSYTFEPSERSQPYIESISKAEQQYGLPKNMLARVIETESQFDPKARSKMGATGIAQIMPKYHPGVDPTDPMASIDYSAKYLKKLYDRFGDWDKALAAYNAGPSRVVKGMDTLRPETVDYLEKINKHRVTKAEPVVEEPIVEPEKVRTPSIFDIGMEGVLGKSVKEYDVTETKPIISEERKSHFMNQLNRTWMLAKNPYDIIKGTAELVSSFPGFMLSTIPAGRAMLERTGKPFTILDLHEAAFGELDRDMAWWQENVSGPVGRVFDTPRKIRDWARKTILGADPEKRLDESAMVGEMFMAPYMAVAAPLHELADSPTYDDWPNCKGIIKFSADAVGFIALGKFYKGGREALLRDTKPIVEKAKNLHEVQKNVDGIPSEAIKSVQQKILDIEKMQLELESAEVQKNLDYGKMIREDLSSKTEQIKKIKQPDKYIVDEQVDKVLKKIPEEKVEEFRGPGAKAEAEMSVAIDELKKKKDRSIIEPTTLNVSDLRVKLAEKYNLSPHDQLVIGEEILPNKDSRIFLQNLFVPESMRKQGVGSNIIKDIQQYARNTEKDIVTSGVKEADVKFFEDRGFVKDGDTYKWSPKKEPTTDLDLQTGTREPIQFSTDKSPFRETPEHSLQMKKVYEEHAKGVGSDIELFTGKLLNDMNLYLDGDKGVNAAQTKNALSELAARADELRMNFAEGKDYPFNFENWKEMVSEAAVWARKAKLDRSIIEPSGTELYSGIPLDKAAKEIVAGAKKFSNYVDRARGMKKFKPGIAAKMLREEFNRSFVDRSGNIRNDLLDKLGDEGYEVVQKMYLAKGASSRAAMMLDQMRKEIYRGLSQNERRIFDKLALADRMIAIGKYKLPGKFRYPKEISSDGKIPDEAIKYRSMFQYIEKLSPEQAKSLVDKVESYFEWMKKPLKDQLDAGLISKEEFNDLSVHKYRRLKLVDIFDKKYTAKVGAKKRTVYDSGVEALARGRDTDLYEPSSEIMALEVFNRAYGRIMNNEANKGLLEVARKDPENPFVRVKEKKGDKIPSGWNRIFMYEEGQRKAIYLSPEMSKEWITSSPETSFRFSQFLRYASGSPVLRTFATGIEWAFALVNLPRDVMHTWFTARSFENGKWKPIYNPVAPVFGLQIGRDLATVFIDAATKGKRYQDYINEGGGMEFLVHQGRLFQRGRHIEGPLDAAYDFLGYFGETTEIMTRLAIRERMIRKGKTPQEATFAARDYMDFGQGGGIAKALDNAFPYLNAAVQGTRGLVRSFKPGSGSALSSTFKLAQFTALTTGVYIAMSKMHPKSFDNLKGNIDMQNNLCLPLGDSFGFEDEKGQMRYPYIKIPLDPGQKFFKTFFEACADKWLGNEIDVNRVIDSLKEFSPVGVGELPPTVSGALGYITNKDFWLNEDIWRRTDPIGYQLPKWMTGKEIGGSEEEYIPGQTPQAFIDAGKLTGLSPERIKYAIEELVTGGSTWAYLLSQGYEELLGDLPESKKQQHLAMVLAKIPVVKRFFGVTNPYSKHATVIDKKEEEVVIRRFTENRGLDVLVEGYLYEKNVDRKEIIDYARKFKDKDTYDRLIDRFKFEEAIKTLPEKSFWRRMKGLTTEARAKVFVDRLDKSTPEEVQELWNEYAIVARTKGIISKEFRNEVNRIRTYGPTPKIRDSLAQ